MASRVENTRQLSGGGTGPTLGELRAFLTTLTEVPEDQVLVFEKNNGSYQGEYGSSWFVRARWNDK